MFFSLIMLSISLQKPGSFMIYLETSEKEVAFTWVGRLFADALIILFVASFGLPGKIMAIVTLFFFLVTLGIAKHRPDIFRDLFRAHEQDPSLGESYNVAPWRAENNTLDLASIDQSESNKQSDLVSVRYMLIIIYVFVRLICDTNDY